MKLSVFKTMLSGICLAGVLASAGSAKANSFTIGDSYTVGLIVPDVPTSPNDEATYINKLLSLGLNASTTFDGQVITRSGNSFSPLDPIVVPTHGDPVGSLTGTGTSVNLGNGYEYLIAKYDHDQGGGNVWYVGGLTGIWDVPATFNGSQFGLSGWTLFDPSSGGDGTPTPDGGSTIALLGFALIGVDQLRRRISKN